jgi:4-amino-4-deoxy-L-arabinose transferase-like glycosyltransferase
MEVDAAQYAEMSYEMFSTGNYFQLFNLGYPYLDKPPLLFWLNSLSFSIFGVHNFSYKLPSLLFALLAVFSTYKLARLYYDEVIARLSTVILATSQAIFLITNDVRTDTMLMGAVAFSVWQWALFFEQGKNRNLIGGSLAVGLALLAKGPIGLIATAAAIVPHLVLKKQWRKLCNFRLVFALVVVVTMLLPMCVGLYQQWGIKGLRFFFWTQSFGRITGESEWNNHPDPLFLVHSSAWAIAPWTVLFFAGWISALFGVIRMRFVSWSRKEYITISGFTLILIALSLSKYQLPHYIFVVFPLAAIITAHYLSSIFKSEKPRKLFRIFQIVIGVSLLLIATFLQYAFMEGNLVSVFTLILLLILVVIVFLKTKDIVLFSALSIIAFNFLLNTFYFPAILKYQPGGDFGRYVKQHKKPGTGFAMYHSTLNFSTAFYANETVVKNIWNYEDLQRELSGYNSMFLISDVYGLEELKQNGHTYELLEERESFPVARMNFQFLNPSTRAGVCSKLFLTRVAKK